MFTLFLIARFETTHMDMAVSFLHSLALISSCSRSIVVLLKPGNKHVGASKAIAICCTFCFCNVLQRYLFENRMMQEQKKRPGRTSSAVLPGHSFDNTIAADFSGCTVGAHAARRYGFGSNCSKEACVVCRSPQTLSSISDINLPAGHSEGISC